MIHCSVINTLISRLNLDIGATTKQMGRIDRNS
jgi:hypothetical protein